MSADDPHLAPRPARWPYRADPPQRYWGNYARYQLGGGRIRLEEDIRGFTAGDTNDGDISRFYFFCLAFDQLIKEGVRGDFAELGVYRGNTAAVIATMARRMGTTAWLLDTFEGFNPDDLRGVDANQKMQFTDTSLDAVRALVGEPNVRYVKGYFPDSAAQMPERLSFSLVHVDCDLYAPMLQALEYFYDRMLPGGYLIIHDYASLAWQGAEQAVDEFFADKPEAPIPLTDGCGSVVVRKARPPGRQSNWLMQQRCGLLTGNWVGAGNGRLSKLLGEGWSAAEEWGVWGIGPSHRLNLYLNQAPAGPLRVDFNVAAALVGSRKRQMVDVLAGDRVLATWEFTPQQNRGERAVLVPADAAVPGHWGFPVIPLEFRPHSVAPVNTLAPDRTDDRALGLALIALRREDPS
jgi:macrocin-O-methyltransferase TylF-like protien